MENSEELIQLQVLGRTIELFIDEAQPMKGEYLETSRLLAIGKSGAPMPLQIIHFRQPELDELL